MAIIALSSLFGFNLGALLVGSRGSDVRPSFVQPPSRTLALVAVSTYSALFLLFLAFATGRSVFSTTNYALEFGEAYESYAQVSQQLVLTPPEQGLLLIKALIFPFALVAFVQYFRTDRLIVVLFLAPLVVSSLFRGTDKEIADFLLLLAVAAALHGLLSLQRILIGVVAICGALYLFLLRRLARYGGDLPACLSSRIGYVLQLPKLDLRALR